MQEQIINGLLSAVVAAAAIFLFLKERSGEDRLNRKQKKMLIRILVSAMLLLALQLVTAEGFEPLDRILFPAAGRITRLALYLIDYGIIGHDILRKAFQGIRNGRVFDENFLMAVATIGAMALAIYENGDYLEAIAVMLFYQIGEWFQGYAVGKSRRNISELMDIRPDYANVEEDGRLIQADPDEVAIGSVIVVQPGEKVPIDGVAVEGISTLNTSALTGESLPREAKPGDEIVSGCINMTGVLKIRTTKEFGESTVSKILDLVENASSRKSKSEDFISKFAKVYTPAVCYSALALALLPPVVRMLFLGLAADWGVWIYRALTFLVISCPCALVISIPLSFFAGIGGASQQGILVKGSNYLEILSQVKCLVFDKTGTLTQGVFEVNGVHHNQMEAQKLVEYAALAESASSHPISKSLKRAYGKEPNRARVSDIQEISGSGVLAKVDGMEVAAGNDKLMRRLGIPYVDCRETGTIIHMAIQGTYAGHIVISDLVKPHAKEAISALKAAGVEETVMLTGDIKKVADQVAASLGIDEAYSELLPGDKVSKVEELMRGRHGKSGKAKLAFVGDGINDAPVLSRADIGIAMGAMGSDAAIEAADIVLMDDDPLKISKAIRISRKCLGIVYQNITLALGIKFACLLLGALGIANMYLAIFADVGVMVLAVLNAIRCLFVKNL
ncbi:MAG: cadmium-translocating P-type ATPase [Lachnospiraceae bacterium]|nr:cadmium-translocating P-type ATPase [Lachnospiraceae bacterium]